MTTQLYQVVLVMFVVAAVIIVVLVVDAPTLPVTVGHVNGHVTSSLSNLSMMVGGLCMRDCRG